MSKETQILKKTDCNRECHRCNILDIAQRRIGNYGITKNENYKGIGESLEHERCPEGRKMKVEFLYPAREDNREVIFRRLKEVWKKNSNVW